MTYGRLYTPNKKTCRTGLLSYLYKPRVVLVSCLVEEGVVRVVAGPHCVEVVPLHHQRVADHGLQRNDFPSHVVVLVPVGTGHRDWSTVHPQLPLRNLDLSNKKNKKKKKRSNKKDTQKSYIIPGTRYRHTGLQQNSTGVHVKLCSKKQDFFHGNCEEKIRSRKRQKNILEEVLCFFFSHGCLYDTFAWCTAAVQRKTRSSMTREDTRIRLRLEDVFW